MKKMNVNKIKEKYEELKQNNDACELIRVIRFREIKKINNKVCLSSVLS